LGGQSEPFQLQVGANANETVELPGADVRTNRLGRTPGVTSGAIDANGIEAGELSLNGTDIRATQAVDDTVSTAQAEGSAISVAAAINDSSSTTGVTATANATVVEGGAIGGGGLDTNNQLIINDVAVVGFDVEADDAGNGLVSAINAQADQTGVFAARDASGGLTLTAQDGRNIDIQTTGNAAAATGLNTSTTTGTVSLSSDEQFDIGGTQPQDTGFQAQTVGDAPGSALTDIDVRTQSGANDAIAIVDRALDDVSRQRSSFGAVQNRLESTINNLTSTSVNLQESNSRIRDADFAKEAAELLRRQILEQAQISVLGQANNLSRAGAIQLLGGG
jgi:flagellin